VQAEHLVHGLVEPRAEPGEFLRAAELFQDFAECLSFIERRCVLAGRLTGPRPSWDTLAVPARAKPTESSPVPLDAKVGPHRYVMHRRIERSKSLLADRGLPITDVALRAGFASQSHFSTAFRRLTNITPGRYRQGLIAGADTRPTGSSG